MLPHQPKSTCIECKSYSLVYSSLADMHRCLECDSLLRAIYVQETLEAFTVYKSPNPPFLLPNYNAIHCISCLDCGGIVFRDAITDVSFCEMCNYTVPIKFLHDVTVNAFRTKLIEKSYNTHYPVFQEKK